MTDSYDLPEADKPKTIWPYLLAGLGILSCCSLIGGVLLLTYGVSTIGTRFSTEAAPFVATARLASTQIAVTQTGVAASLVSANATTTQAAAATPVLQNDFDLNTGDWLVGKDNDPQRGSINRRVGEGKYTWKLEPADGVIWYSYPDVAQTTDLLAEVEVEKISGSDESSFGLILRLTNSGSYYYFYLAPAGQYFGVSMQHQQQWQRLVGGTYSPVINTTGSNKLAVLASGPNFSLYINDVFVGSFSDATLASGRVGLAVDAYDAGEDVEVEFDNFVLWNSDVVSPRGTAPIVATYTARPAVTATPAVTTTPSARLPFDVSGRIAYRIAGGLMVMNADSSNNAKLEYHTDNDLMYSNGRSPQFSPSGESLIFLNDQVMYILNLANHTYYPLNGFDYRPLDPAWSPDAKHIAFVSTAIRTTNQYHELYLKELGTNNDPYPLTNSRQIESDPTWSADGSQIAFAGGDDGKFSISIIDADGSNSHPLTDGTTKDTEPDWSPDGGWILFTSERDGNRELYLIRPDGSELTRLTNNPADDFGATWSPDGSYIAFISDRDGSDEIYIMKADGSQSTRLTYNETKELELDWGP